MARPYPTRWSLTLALLAILSGCAGAQQQGPTVESQMRAKMVQPQSPPPPRLQPMASDTPPASTPPPPATPAPLVPAQPPAEAKPWPTTNWRGVEFVDVRDLAQRFDLKLETAKSGATVTLSEKGVIRLTFDEKQRDFYFEGLRLFLGESIIREKDTLWVSKLDVVKIVAVLIQPAARATSLPAGPLRTIVLDPGHGGNDPGKENQLLKVNEKTFTLDVAVRLQKLLEQQGWRVWLTRTTDTMLSSDKTLDLQRRADFANQHKADLFVSIHFNAVERDPQRVTGVETYTLAPQHLLSTAAEQKDEMTGIAFPGNRYDDANVLLGERLHRAMIGSLKASDRGGKRARFSVLRFVQCPGALVECAYLSNEAEARRAATPEYRQQIALALAKGIENFSATLASVHPKAPPEPATSATVSPDTSRP